MKSTRYFFITFFLLTCFTLFACTVESEPTVVATVTKTTSAAMTSTVTRTIAPTQSPTMTNMPVVPVPTRTYAPEMEGAEYTLATSTPTLPAQSFWHLTPIPSNNNNNPLLHDGQTLPAALILNRYTIKDLALVAEWGKGKAGDVAFAPDGNTFAVSNRNGYMIYDAIYLDAEPRWNRFDKSFYYDSMLFDEDGAVVRFTYEHNHWDASGGQLVKEDSYNRYHSGLQVENREYYQWTKPLNQYDPYELEGKYISSDEQYQFTFSMDWECGWYGDWEEDEDDFPDQYAGYLRNLATGETIKIGEDEPCISYKERSHPEGCDMYVFSPCGNAIADYALNAMHMDFSPDGKTFTLHYHWEFSRDEDSFLKIYDLSTGIELFQIGDFDDPVQDFAYSPSGSHLAVAFFDGSVELWDVKREKPILHRHDFSSQIRYAEISADGKYLLVQSHNVLDIYQVQNGVWVNSIPAVTFAVSPNEPVIATSEENGTIYIRQLPDGKIVQTLRNHSTFVYEMSYSSDGKYFLSSGEDCKLLLWNLSRGTVQTYLDPVWVDGLAGGDTSSRMFVYYFEVIPDLNEVVGFGSWGTAGFWDMETGEVKNVINSRALEYYNGMMTIKPHYPSQFYMDQEEGYFSIGTSIFDLKTKEMIEGEEFPVLPYPACYLPDISTADGEIEMAVGMESLEDMYCVLDVDTSELLGALDIFPTDYWDQITIAQLLITPDGKRIIGLTTSGTFYIFQVNK